MNDNDAHDGNVKDSATAVEENDATITEDEEQKDELDLKTQLSEAEQNLLVPDKAPVYQFVMTGGPCGGKTTALARVFMFLRERGFEVITCPEAFTLLASNGMSMDFFTTDGMATIIQAAVLDTQLSLEDSVRRILKARGKPAVILCDRGAMDGSVYIAPEEFEKVMADRNTNVVELRDRRYDAIFHLVTAADGAPHAYTLENNLARTETAEIALELDRKMQNAWTGHPHLYVLDNSTDFEGKMNRLVDVISKLVGLPSNLKRRSAKFLLSAPPDRSQFPPDMHVQVFEVEKAYIKQTDTSTLLNDSYTSMDSHATVSSCHGSHDDDETYAFVRRRTSMDEQGQLLGSVYQLTMVQRSGSELIERKRIISRREYLASFHARDPSRHVVVQRRWSFLYHHQSFTLHIYQHPNPGLCILHAQVEATTEEGAVEVELPPFLHVDRRIENTPQDDEAYGAYSLSIIKR
jgi:predicted ATPase